MSVVNTERLGKIMLIQLNRPERMNALGAQLRAEMADAFNEFQADKDLEVAVFTGTGRAFCAGEDMKESLKRGTVGSDMTTNNPFMDGTLDKPVIAAVNGFAMGGGFMLVERTDLRVAVPGATFHSYRLPEAAGDAAVIHVGLAEGGMRDIAVYMSLARIKPCGSALVGELQLAATDFGNLRGGQ